MPVSDDIAPFRAIPECAALLSNPQITWSIPYSRKPKRDTEDSLFAETLKTSRNLTNCVVFYPTPTLTSTLPDPPPQILVPEINVLMTLGDGLNGFPRILHGGIVATLIDESMGMLQAVNLRILRSSRPESSDIEFSRFTLDLRIKFVRPVVTPGVVWIVVKNVKLEGRKQWLSAELKQFLKSPDPSAEGGKVEEGEWKVCSTGEGLWVQPRKVAHKI